MSLESLQAEVRMFLQEHEFVTPTRLLRTFEGRNYTKEAIAKLGSVLTELIRSGEVKLTVEWGDIPTVLLSLT